MNVPQFLPPLFLCAALVSCTTGDLVFATRSSIGVEVTGEQTIMPDHVNIGYRRRELIAAGDHAPKNGNLLAKLDMESHFINGLAIQETFATGKAALDVAKAGTPNALKATGDSPSSDQPVIFGSRTRFGLALTMPGAEDQGAPTLLAGFSRRIATVIRSKSDQNLPSVAAAVSINSNGWSSGSGPKGGVADGNRLRSDAKPGSVRITQFFATGDAAENLTTEQKKDIAEAVVTSPVSPPKEAAEKASNPQL
jgi:hypothetical protein